MINAHKTRCNRHSVNHWSNCYLCCGFKTEDGRDISKRCPADADDARPVVPLTASNDWVELLLLT